MPNNHGGKRAGAGRKPGSVNIVKKLILTDIAMKMWVGRDQAGRILGEYNSPRSPESILGPKRVANLREWGSGKDGAIYLDVLEEAYLERRKGQGFKA